MRAGRNLRKHPTEPSYSVPRGCIITRLWVSGWENEILPIELGFISPLLPWENKEGNKMNMQSLFSLKLRQRQLFRKRNHLHDWKWEGPNLYNVICQLYLSGAEKIVFYLKKKKQKLLETENRLLYLYTGAFTLQFQDAQRKEIKSTKVEPRSSWVGPDSRLALQRGKKSVKGLWAYKS